MKRSIIIYLILCSPACFGQAEKLIVPTDLRQQTIVTEPLTLRKGFLRTGFMIDYRVADRYFDDSGEKNYYNTNTWGSNSAYSLNLQYGITERFEVDLVSEYMNTLQETKFTEVIAATNTTLTSTAKQKGIGLGDSHIYLKYQIIPEGEKRFSFSGNLGLTIPTGEKNPRNIKSENQYDLPVGDGTYALYLNMSVRKVIYPYSLGGYVSYTNNFNGKKLILYNDTGERRFRLGNLFETGLIWNLHLNEWIVFGNEADFNKEGQGKIENIPSSLIPASWSFSYQPSLIFQVHRFRLGELVNIPLSGKNVPADPIYIISVQYVF